MHDDDLPAHDRDRDVGDERVPTEDGLYTGPQDSQRPDTLPAQVYVSVGRPEAVTVSEATVNTERSRRGPGLDGEGGRSEFVWGGDGVPWEGWTRRERRLPPGRNVTYV